MNSTPTQHCDLGIIGAGAAGLFAAIFAGRNMPDDSRVLAFDGAKKLGAKILIAGGGRCNVTHDVVRPEDYAGGPGSTRNAVKKVLRSFTVKDTIAFFNERGVELKREETGKLFPTTDRARTVLNALLESAYEANAKLLTDHRVTGLERAGDGFLIRTSQGGYETKRVVLATGGLALPKSGSDGVGYGFAKAMGHTVSATWPALVPLVLPGGHWLTGLKGIAAEVELVLADAAGKVLHRQGGPMLLTHFGLSGPAAMDMSRHFGGFAGGGERDGSGLSLTVNLLPGKTFESVEGDVLKQASATPRRTVLQVVQGHLPERFAAAVVQHAAGLEAGLALSQLSKEGRRRLVRSLVALALPVQSDRGYEFAEVTAGGVPLSEVNLSTMESRVCPGLFLAGELLDVDGRIGGYNFQWAWCTGRLAGLAAAKAMNAQRNAGNAVT